MRVFDEIVGAPHRTRSSPPTSTPCPSAPPPASGHLSPPQAAPPASRLSRTHAHPLSALAINRQRGGEARRDALQHPPPGPGPPIPACVGGGFRAPLQDAQHLRHHSAPHHVRLPANARPLHGPCAACAGPHGPLMPVPSSRRAHPHASDSPPARSSLPAGTTRFWRCAQTTTTTTGAASSSTAWSRRGSCPTSRRCRLWPRGDRLGRTSSAFPWRSDWPVETRESGGGRGEEERPWDSSTLHWQPNRRKVAGARRALPAGIRRAARRGGGFLNHHHPALLLLLPRAPAAAWLSSSGPALVLACVALPVRLRRMSGGEAGVFVVDTGRGGEGGVTDCWAAATWLLPADGGASGPPPHCCSPPALFLHCSLPAEPRAVPDSSRNNLVEFDGKARLAPNIVSSFPPLPAFFVALLCVLRPGRRRTEEEVAPTSRCLPVRTSIVAAACPPRSLSVCWLNDRLPP